MIDNPTAAFMKVNEIMQTHVPIGVSCACGFGFQRSTLTRSVEQLARETRQHVAAVIIDALYPPPAADVAAARLHELIEELRDDVPDDFRVEIEETGGGCRAVALDSNGRGFLLVTADDGGIVPFESASDDVLVGAYNDDGEWLDKIVWEGPATTIEQRRHMHDAIREWVSGL